MFGVYVKLYTVQLSIIYLLVTKFILKKRTADWLRRTISHVPYISGKWQNLFAASEREKVQRCHRRAPFRMVYFPGQKIRCTCYSRFGARTVLTRGESSYCSRFYGEY